MNLEDVREHIDRIDAQLIKLFNERLDLAPRVVKAKLEMGKPVFDPGRERDKLASIAQVAPQDRQAQLISLFSLLMNMNKIEQNRYLASLDQKPQSKSAINTLLPADAQFPITASVACQGVEGAYSQLAASKLFKVPSITFFDTFEGVFRAVRDGLCDYGVLPIENSTAGSVNAVYDLLAQYRFSIVRSLRLKIDHNLVAKPGTRRTSKRLPNAPISLNLWASKRQRPAIPRRQRSSSHHLSATTSQRFAPAVAKSYITSISCKKMYRIPTTTTPASSSSPKTPSYIRGRTAPRLCSRSPISPDRSIASSNASTPWISTLSSWKAVPSPDMTSISCSISISSAQWVRSRL